MNEKHKNALNARIAADVGGTFTDIAVFDEQNNQLVFGKSLSTNAKIIDGIENALGKTDIQFSQSSLFLHGATVAINTLLERKGAKTALITTNGFRDIYEIGRVNRPEAYNLFFKKHVPLVDRSLRYEVNERILSNGSILQAINLKELEQISEKLKKEKIESIAILFLNSYKNSIHESVAKEYFQQKFPDCYVTASFELSQEYREFERTSTVAANAYIGPKVSSYLEGIESHLTNTNFKGTFLVVQSTGGLYSASHAKKECIRMLESGPAAGVIGTRELCRNINIKKAIAFDMGGTTAKSGVILDGEVLMTSNSIVGGYVDGLPVQIPMIDIQEVGTGGGSIAKVESAGSLRVGPRSAGSFPGPACYDLGGTEATVTDANLVLGRLACDRFLGGNMKLNLEKSIEAINKHIAEPLALSLENAADGIIRIAASSMASVVKRVTTERGLDARDFPLVSFGGAGPLHAAFVARELNITKVIVPPAPGHFSAFGMLLSDLRRDFVLTTFTSLNDFDFESFEKKFDQMEKEGASDISGDKELTNLKNQRSLDMRYVGQEHAVTVEIPKELFTKSDKLGIKKLFDDVHYQRYGYSSKDELSEVVSIRTSVVGVLNKPGITKYTKREGGLNTPKFSIRKVYFHTDGGWHDSKVFARSDLFFGDQIIGPALIEEYASTTVVPPKDILEVDQFGNLIILISQEVYENR